jgi:hypothetical protein
MPPACTCTAPSADDLTTLHATCPAPTAADADSDDEGDERQQAEVAKIRANARLVSQCGQTLQPGAWRGCCKSPW